MDRHTGLLIVHGIGEQKRFDTLRGIARSILASIKARDESVRFSVIDRTAQSDDMPMTCPRIDRQGSPLVIAYQGEGDEHTTYVHLHEVWWADLGASRKFGEQVRFWRWSLGRWFAKVHWDVPSKTNTTILMDPPTMFRDFMQDENTSPPSKSVRFKLFLTALYALLTFLSWEAAKRVFSWLRSVALSPSILTAYIGDVRIYTQSPKEADGHLADIGMPWRATIRRRMVSELVAMAERDYHGWYVLAHSLGSVLAFNGLQEPEWNLPNYLDLAQVERIKAGSHGKTLWRNDSPPPKGLDLKKYMMPTRPAWLGESDRIPRAVLFDKFRGLITYGSPLDKFAALWPRIVPVNKDRELFAKADWVNLYDVTDPVGAKIDAYEGEWRNGVKPGESPLNVSVKASRIFLLSHIRYFGVPPKGRANRHETRALVNLLFPPNGKEARLVDLFRSVGEARQRPILRAVWAVTQIVVLGLLLLSVTSCFAAMLIGLVYTSISGHHYSINIHDFIGLMAKVLAVAVFIVTLAGVTFRRDRN
jgi:hypothetical protein